MRLAGFEPVDYEHDYFEVWPENWPAFAVYQGISNQWRTGMNGPVALDYGVLFHCMDRMHLEDDEYDRLFDDVKVIEAGALSAIHAKK
jgi:hypothetical protein